MRNALGAVQSVVVLGGSSDIGAAIADRLVASGCRAVVLAGRSPEAMAPVAERLATAGATTLATTRWDALDIDGHEGAVDAAFAAVGADVDLVLLAAGVLGDQRAFEADPTEAARAVSANYTGAVSTLLHVAARLRHQGHGTIVVLSSVAGERTRTSNFVYGSSKAGLDAFAQGLGDSLVGTGVGVLVVRPGFVTSSMTEGMDPAPLSTTPEAVADAVVDGLAKGREIVWVPAPLRVLMGAFRHLPRPLWRKVSAGR